jgi:flagellar protein FliJ
MRKFKFNLQRVLDYRETIEDKLLGELAAARAQHDREIEKLTEVTRARDQFRRRMRRQLTSGDPDEIKRAYFYLNDLVKRVQSQEMAVSQAEEFKNLKTTEVVEASKDRKVLERLRDYKLVEYTSDLHSQEQKFLDDLATIRSNRSKAGSVSEGGHA